MADVAPAIVGVGLITTAQIFAVCADSFESLRAVKSFGRDYTVMVTRYGVQKARLLAWGREVGLSREIHTTVDPRLHQETIRAPVEDVLHCIRMLLADADKLKSRYKLRPSAPHLVQPSVTDAPNNTGAVIGRRRLDSWRSSHADFDNRLRNQDRGVPLIRKTEWAFRGKREFKSVISELEDLIGDLYHLLPIQSGRSVNAIEGANGLNDGRAPQLAIEYPSDRDNTVFASAVTSEYLAVPSEDPVSQWKQPQPRIIIRRLRKISKKKATKPRPKHRPVAASEEREGSVSSKESQKISHAARTTDTQGVEWVKVSSLLSGNGRTGEADADAAATKHLGEYAANGIARLSDPLNASQQLLAHAMNETPTTSSIVITQDQFIAAAVVGGVGAAVGIVNAGTGIVNARAAQKSAAAAECQAMIAADRLVFDKQQAAQEDSRSKGSEPDSPDGGDSQEGSKAANSPSSPSSQPSRIPHASQTSLPKQPCRASPSRQLLPGAPSLAGLDELPRAVRNQGTAGSATARPGPNLTRAIEQARKEKALSTALRQVRSEHEKSVAAPTNGASKITRCDAEPTAPDLDASASAVVPDFDAASSTATNDASETVADPGAASPDESPASSDGHGPNPSPDPGPSPANPDDDGAIEMDLLAAGTVSRPREIAESPSLGLATHHDPHAPSDSDSDDVPSPKPTRTPPPPSAAPRTA